MAVDVTVLHPYGFRPKDKPLLRVFVVFALNSTAKITYEEITPQLLDVPNLGKFKPVSKYLKPISEQVGGPFQYLYFVRYDSPFTVDFDEKKLRIGVGAVGLAPLAFSIDIGGIMLPNPSEEVETPVIEIDPCDLS